VYQSIGLAKVFTLFALIAGVVAVGTFWLLQPTTLLGWWKPISFGMTASSLLIIGIGQSPLFPLLCRLRGLRDIAPDISGTWRATLNSNWPTIAKLSGLEPSSGAPITADIKVVARLLHVKIRFCSDSKYSKSKSVSVSIHRDEHDGNVRLYYTYENTTENPLSSDCSHHFGSAYVDVSGTGGDMILEGLYWTNRNWNEGLNTAGTITWARPSDLTASAV
jgi:hypothetical protein